MFDWIRKITQKKPVPQTQQQSQNTKNIDGRWTLGEDNLTKNPVDD